MTHRDFDVPARLYDLPFLAQDEKRAILGRQRAAALRAAGAAAVRDLDAALADPLAAPAEKVQRLLGAAVRLYAARAEAGLRKPPFGPIEPTATDVAVTVTAMLAAVRIELFELGMWQSWS